MTLLLISIFFIFPVVAIAGYQHYKIVKHPAYDADKTLLNYEIIGAGENKLVLLHGLTGSLNYWKRNLESIPKTDIRYVYDVPDNVMNILQTSCYDCHSNNTNYPWYSDVQPMRFLMDKHIREGKEELNFNEFGSYSDRRKKNKLKSIIGQIKDEEMPPLSYTFMHGNTHFLKEEKIKLIEWIVNLKDKVQKNK